MAKQDHVGQNYKELRVQYFASSSQENQEKVAVHHFPPSALKKVYVVQFLPLKVRKEFLRDSTPDAISPLPFIKK